MAEKWQTDPRRLSEYPGHNDPATSRQIAYIEHLAAVSPDIAEELEYAVNAFETEGGGHHITGCTKGEAMYIIKCFKGEIKPINTKNIPDNRRRTP